MIAVTGAAGFIGSGLIWGLNERGERDILAVDVVDHTQKKLNLAPLSFTELIEPQDFRRRLLAGGYDGTLQAVLHMGANSSTSAGNWDELEETNVRYSKDVIEYCVQNGIRIVYASSASVYGDGNAGYSDNEALFEKLAPLNLYGTSKLLVDIWARDRSFLHSAAGLRYFNVFGPNEYHKGEMRSVIAKCFPLAREKGVITLFKSYKKEYGDGEQKRDFVYIKDVVAATLFFLDHPEKSGVFNIGTGVARSWNDVARAIFAALGRSGTIRYMEMPEGLQKHYQYFTEADISKLRVAGYNGPFRSLEASIVDYASYVSEERHLTHL